MTTDRIESETLVAAPLDRVWSLVTEPGWWVADEGSLAGTVVEDGAEMLAKNATYGEFPLTVVKVEPQRYLAYRWASAFPGEELRGDNSTLIEFTLTPEGDQVRLRVVESGFAALRGTDELREQAFADNTGGWVEMLGKVRKQAESGV